jgi:ketosteroid isomerase-like protein
VRRNEADSRSYMLELLKRPDGSQMLVSGRYDDRLRRDADGQWRFVTRSYTVLQVKA